MDPLGNAVGFQKLVSAACANDSAIIPGTDDKVLGFRQADQDFSKQPVLFTKFHLAKSGQRIAATIVSALKAACIEIGAQSVPQRS